MAALGLSAAILGASLGAGGLAQAAEPPPRPQTVEFRDGFPVTSKDKLYPLSRVQRGDRGVGYTVFAEDRIEPFQVEVLGIMESMLGPGRHVILAKLSGERIEFTGVIAGMSGSPVYIDGKLVGAVAYRFGAFSREPIAGITPIESMLDVYGAEVEPRLDPRRTAARDASGRGISAAQLRDRAMLPPVGLEAKTPVLAGPHDPKPIETPVMISGLDPRVAEDLKGVFAAAGLTAVTGGGGAGKTQVQYAPRASGARQVSGNGPGNAGAVSAAPIAPGAPVAALLMRGDVNIAAIGTVTMVENGRMLGFGHPFLGHGHVQLPMATAAILNTLASEAGSFKQGSPALEVGSISHDRLTAIAGDLGSVAPMVPVRVLVQRSDEPIASPGLTTQVEIVDSPVWLPVMLDSIIATASARRMGYEAGGTVDLQAFIHVGDRTVEINDTYSAPAPMRVSAFAARDIANSVSVIARNEIADVDLRGVDIRLRINSELALSQVEEVVPDRSVVRPGEQLGLTVKLRPYQKPLETVRLSVPIPADATGDLEVYVGGGVELDRRDGDVYGERIPSTVDDVLGIVAERRQARALFARVYLQRAGLRVRSEVMTSLPPSQRALLLASGGRGTKSLTEALGPTAELPMTDVVVGGVAVPVRVVR